MKGLLLVLVWPEAVWRHLRERPLPAARLVRMAVPLSLACAIALHLGLDCVPGGSSPGSCPEGGSGTTPLSLFGASFGGTFAMALVFTLFAPWCRGQRDFTRSLNLAFFGLAPVWLAAPGAVVLPAVVVYPFALAWSGYLLLAGVRIVLEVDEAASGEFLVGSIAASIVAAGAWGFVLDAFAPGG